MTGPAVRPSPHPGELMRPLLALAACAALAAPPAAAQTPISAGPLVGLNLADVTGSDFSDAFGDTGGRLGFALGGFAEFGITPQLVLRPELVWSQKGATVEEPGLDLTLKLDYVQLPVLAKFFLGGTESGARFHLLVGPGFGFSAGCEFEVDDVPVVGVGPALAEAATMAAVDCDDVGAETEGFEVAGILGGGVDFARFTVDVRMDRAFTEIFDADDVDSKNQTFSLRAGYKFRVR